ncbi:MAG: PIN domain-containing protein [Acidimicrobiales bacterium]
MTAFVDTNVLVRHLTGDPPTLASRATAYLAAGELLLVPDLIVAETVYVLESFYEVPRPLVAEAIRSLVAFESVICVDPALMLRTVELFELERMDFADAYLVANAETTGVDRVASFDRDLDRIPGIDRVEP